MPRPTPKKPTPPAAPAPQPKAAPSVDELEKASREASRNGHTAPQKQI